MTKFDVENNGFTDLALPENRPFCMGITPWPYDFTPEALEETYKTVNQHTDLIAHHFDWGIPWSEALAGKPYHSKVREDINFRLSHLQKGQKVYVAVTPIAFLRNGFASYWGKDPYWAENSSMKLPNNWQDKDFDDPDAIEAYTNFCRYMIQRFHPDYMAYGIEVNMLANGNPTAFKKYLIMTERVYKTLKEEYPELPLFLTIHIESFIKSEEIVRQLLPFTDYIAVSTYPYMDMKYENPDDLPKDWFSRIRDIAPDKPFAVAETGFTAEDVFIEKGGKIFPRGMKIKGKEKWQANYVQFLLNESKRLDAKFIVWFFTRDIDLFWNRKEKMKKNEDFLPADILRIFCNAGLFDGKGKSRLSLKIWDAWLKLPRS